MAQQNRKTPILRHKSAATSATVYLQLISVIQSMALGLFVFRLAPGKVFTDANYFLECALILQIIVITWHEYVVGTIIYDWPLGYFDAWIPIAFGISQYYLISNLNGDFTYFSWSVGLFALVALAAFINQHFKSAKYEKNKDVIELLKKHRISNIWQTIGFFLLFGAFATIAPAIKEVHWLRLMLVILNLCLIIHQVRGTISTRFLFHEKSRL